MDKSLDKGKSWQTLNYFAEKKVQCPNGGPRSSDDVQCRRLPSNGTVLVNMFQFSEKKKNEKNFTETQSIELLSFTDIRLVNADRLLIFFF